MPPMAAASDADPAVQTAQAAFRTTATQQLKRLMAQGVEETDASSRLMDELLPHRPPHASAAAAAATASSSQDVQEVVARTGFSPEQASKTLLLHEEIRRLRCEGHSTATVIDQLSRRLRNVGQQTRSRRDENGDQAAHHRTHGGPVTKKHKLAEEGAITTFTGGGECYLARAQTDKSDKRRRDETAPLAQLKKLKLRPPGMSSES